MAETPYDDDTWTNLANAGANDGNNVEITAATFDANDYTYVLYATNFGFAIPAGSVILGIQVDFERGESAGSAVDDLVQIVKGGTRQGDNKSAAAVWNNGGMSVGTFGGAADLWGLAWTAADINSANFGVAIAPKATGANTDVHIDYITITVTYNPVNATSYTNDSEGGLNNLGGRTGQTITVTGTGFGAGPCSNTDPETTVWIGGKDTGYEVLCAAVTTWNDTTITFSINSAISSYGGAGASGLTVERSGDGDPSPLDFAVYPNITSTSNTVSADAEREYDSGDSEGVITINGTRFGTAGTVTILGQTATQNSYADTAIEVRVPTGIADNSYTGSIVVTRTTPADNLTDTYSGFRVLPRITSLSPSSGCVGSSVTINGSHFCQSGSCPASPAWSSAAHNVTFNGTQAADGDFTSWADASIVVDVPTGATTGNVVVTSDTAYTSNAVSFTVDANPPNQASWNPANGATTTTSPTVTFTLNKNGDCRWSLDGDEAYDDMADDGDCSGDGTTSISCGTSGLTGPSTNVYFACEDTCGNKDTAGTNDMLTYNVDTLPPSQSGWSPADASETTSSPTITLTLDEDGDCRWSLDGDETYDGMSDDGDCSGDGTTSITCATTGLVEGAEVVYIACQDTAGNKDTAGTNDALNYTVDATYPVQSNWSPAKGATIASTSQTVTFDLDENGDCKWSLTDQAYGAMADDCSGDGTTSITCNVTGMAEGAEYVYIACRDTAPGNEDTASTNEHVNYTIDTTPPTQSSWSPADSATVCSTSQTVTYTLNEAGDCKWSLTDQAYGAMAGDCTGDGTTSMSCGVTGMSLGAEVVYFACRDTALNADTVGSNTAINYTVVTDTTPPTQSSHNPAPPGPIESSETLTLNISANGDCRWSTSDQAYSAMGNDCSGDGTQNITCILAGLPEGAVTVYVSCRKTACSEDTAGSNTALAYTVSNPPPPPTAGISAFYNDADPFSSGAATTIITTFSTSTTKFDTQIEILYSTNTNFVRRFHSSIPGLGSPDANSFDEDWEATTASKTDNGSFIKAGTYIGKAMSGLTWTYNTKIEGSGITMARPAGVFVDGNNNIYFVNKDDEVVEKINTNHTLLVKFDAGADGAVTPQGVAADSSGNIYVADSTNDRIMKYNSSGALVNANYITGVNEPKGLYVYNDFLYIAAYSDSKIKKYNLSTGAQSWEAGTDASPNDVAVGVFSGAVRVFATIASQDEINTFNDTDGSDYTVPQSSLGCDVPAGIDVDSRSAVQYLYVSCTGAADNYIKKYNLSDGLGASETSMYTFGTGGAGGSTSQVNTAAGVGKTSGSLYIGDTENNRLLKLTDTGAALTYSDTVEPDDYNLFVPTDMAIDGDGNIYIGSEQGNFVKKFTKDGQYVAKYGAAGTGSGQFNNVTGVEVYDGDGDGDADLLFVSDFGNNRIQCLDMDTSLWNSAGSCGGSWGASGIAVGEPRGMGFDKSNNYVLVSYNAGGGDKGINRYQVNGTFVSNISSAAIIDDVASDFRGATSHTTSASEQVRTEEAGNVNADCGGAKQPPYGITTDNFGNIYVTSTNDSTCGQVVKYGYHYTAPTTTASMELVSQFGTVGTGDGEFAAPRGIAVDPNGTFIWVADRDNNRAQKFLLTYDATKYDNITICDAGAPPTVNSVLLSDPSPTKAGTVQFSVAFSACSLQPGYYPKSWFVTADSVSVQIYDESVIRDNGTVSNQYDSGDTLLIGRPPPIGTALVAFASTEKHVEFASGTEPGAVYDGGAVGEAICKDADSDNVCDTGELLYGKTSTGIGQGLIAFTSTEMHPDWNANGAYDGFFVNNEWKGFGVVPSGHDGIATINVCGQSPTYDGVKTDNGTQMTACNNAWTFEIDSTAPTCDINVDELVTTETWTPAYGEAETSCNVRAAMTDFSCFASDADDDDYVDASENITGCSLGTDPCCALGDTVMNLTTREKHVDLGGGTTNVYDAGEGVIYDNPTQGNVGFYDPTFDTIILCSGATTCAAVEEDGSCTSPCYAPTSGDSLIAFTSTEKVIAVSYQDVTTSAASSSYYANNISLPAPVPGYKYFSCLAEDDADNEGSWYQPRVRVRRLASLPGRAEFEPTTYDRDETLSANNTWTVRFTAAGTFDPGTCDCGNENCYVTIDIPAGWTAPTNVTGAPGEVAISPGPGVTMCGTSYEVSGQGIKVLISEMPDGAYLDVVYGYRGNGGSGAAIGTTAGVGNTQFTVKSCNDCGGTEGSLDNPSLTVHALPMRVSHQEFLGGAGKLVIYDEEADVKVMTVVFKNPNSAPNTAYVTDMKINLVAAGASSPYTPDEIVMKVKLKNGAGTVIIEDSSIETTGSIISLEGLSGSPIAVNPGAETGIELFMNFQCLSASCTTPSGLTSLEFLIDADYDLATGTSTGLTEMTLTDTTKSWATNQWSGYTLIPKTSAPTKNYVITYNTATALTVTSGNTMVTDGGTTGTYAIGDEGTNLTTGKYLTGNVLGASLKFASNRAQNDTFYPDTPTAGADMGSGAVTQFKPPPIAQGVYVTHDNTTWPYLSNQKVSKGQTSTEPFKLRLRMMDSLLTSSCANPSNCSSVDVSDGAVFAMGDSVIIGDADSSSSDANSYDQRSIINITGNTLDLDSGTSNGPYAATNTAYVVRTTASAKITGLDVTVTGDGQNLPDPSPNGLVSRKELERGATTLADTTDIESSGSEITFDAYLDQVTGNPVDLDTADFPVDLDFRVDMLCSGTPSSPQACPTGTNELKVKFSIPSAGDFTPATSTTQILPSPWVSLTSATATIQDQAWVTATSVNGITPYECPGEIGIGETFYIDTIVENAAATGTHTRASARMYSSANDLKFICVSGSCTPGGDYTSEFTVTPTVPLTTSYITVQAGATGSMQYSVVQSAGSPTPGVYDIDVKYAASVSTSKPEARDLNDFYDSDKLYVNRDTDGAATSPCGLEMKAAPAYLSARAVSPGEYQPGAVHVPILSLRLTDGPDTPVGWWFREVVIGSANSDDTDVTNLVLWSDRDDDGVFEPNGADGPALATTTFSGGFATFTGWADATATTWASPSQYFFVSYNLDTTITDGNTIDAYAVADGATIYNAATGTYILPGSDSNSAGTSYVDVIATKITMLPDGSTACIGGQKTIYAYAYDVYNNLDTDSTEYITVAMTEGNANNTAQIATTTALTSEEYLPATGPPYTTVKGNLVAGVGDVTFLETESDTITLTPSSSLGAADSSTTVGGNVCLTSKNITNTSYAAGATGAAILKFMVTNGLGEAITVDTINIMNTGTAADNAISAVKLYKTSIAAPNLLGTTTFSGGTALFSPGTNMAQNEMLDFYVTYDIATTNVTDNTTLNNNIYAEGLSYSTATASTLDVVSTDSTGNSWIDIDGNTVRLLPPTSKTALTADCASGTATATVADTTYLVGEPQVTIGDDYDSQVMTVDTVVSGTQVRFTTNVSKTHLAAANGYVSNVITNMKELRIKVEDTYGNVASQDSEGNVEIFSIATPNPSYVDASTFKLLADGNCSAGTFTQGGTTASGCLTNGYATNTIGYSGCAPQTFIVTPNSTLSKYDGREYTAAIDFPGDISLDTSAPEDIAITFGPTVSDMDCINTAYPTLYGITGTDDCSGVQAIRFACDGTAAAFANAEWVDIGIATTTLDVCCNCEGDARDFGCGFNINNGSTCKGGFLADGTCSDPDGWVANASSGCINGGPNRVYVQVVDKAGNATALPTATSTVRVITDVTDPVLNSFYFSSNADTYFLGSADAAIGICDAAQVGTAFDGDNGTQPHTETDGDLSDECALWYSNTVDATQTVTIQLNYDEVGSTPTFRGSAAFGEVVQTIDGATGTGQTVSLTYDIDSADGTAATTSITFSLTDDCGNGATETFDFWRDVTAPSYATATGYDTAGMAVTLTDGFTDSSAWYNYANPYFQWATTSDLPSGAAYLANAALRDYMYEFSTDSGAAPLYATSGSSFTATGPLTSGEFYYLRFMSYDNVNNSPVASSTFRYQFDSTPPDNPTVSASDTSGGAVALSSGSWYNYANPNFWWTGATDLPASPPADGNSGFDQFNLFWGDDIAGAPNYATDGYATDSALALVSGEYYYLRMNSEDIAGNATGTTQAFVYGFDNTPPNNPTVSASDTSGGAVALASGSWYNYTNPSFWWSGSSDLPASPPADGNAGFAQFNLFWGDDIAGAPNFATDGYATDSALALVSGEYYYLRMDSEDNAGNATGTSQMFVYGFDNTPPNNPTVYASDTSGGAVALASGSWYNYTNPSFWWSGATDLPASPPADGNSGFNQFNLFWGDDIAGAPNFATDGYATDSALALVSGEYYYLRMNSEDNATNATGTSQVFVYGFDNTPPNNPTVSASDTSGGAVALASGSWYNYTNPSFWWSGATDLPASPPADGNAGFDQFNLFWGDNIAGAPSYATDGYATDSALALVSGEYYYLRMNSEDTAGNATGTTQVFVYGFDNTPPNNPTVYASDTSGGAVALASGSWYNYTNPSFWWSGSSDLPASPPADGNAGFDQFNLFWGDDIAGAPNYATDGYATDSALSLVSGYTYYLRMNSEDNAGNATGTNQMFVYKFDDTAPNNPTITAYDNIATTTTLVNNTWYRYPNPYFTWSGASDLPAAPANSGVALYNVYFGTDSSGAPTFATTSTALWASQTLASNTVYYLRMNTQDTAGNATGTTTVFTYKYDPDPPVFAYAAGATAFATETNNYMWVSSITKSLYYGLGMGVAAQEFTLYGAVTDSFAGIATVTYSAAFGNSPTTEVWSPATPTADWSSDWNSDTYDVIWSDSTGATVTMTAYDAAGNSAATQVQIIQNNRLYIQYATMTPPWLPSFTKFDLFYPDYTATPTYATATPFTDDTSPNGMYRLTPDGPGGAASESLFIHAWKNTGGAERGVYDDSDDTINNSFYLNTLDYSPAGGFCGSVASANSWCLEVTNVDCVNQSSNPHFLGASGTFSADGFLTYLPSERTIDGDLNGGTPTGTPASEGDPGTFTAQSGPNHMLVMPMTDADTEIPSWCAGGGCAPACNANYCSTGHVFPHQPYYILSDGNLMDYSYSVADTTNEWSWDATNSRVEVNDDLSANTVTYRQQDVGLIQADGAVTNWCGNAPYAACSFACGANFCSNLTTPLPIQPDFVKYNGSVLTEDDAAQAGEWDWNATEKQVMLFDTPSGATVTYTPGGESQLVCVYLMDACNQVITEGKWKDVPVMLSLSDAPDSDKDITLNSDAAYKGFNFAAVPNPPDALNSDLDPPDQTQTRGKLKNGMACVGITAEFAPSDDPQTPIKISPYYYDEDSGATTTLPQNSGYSDRPGFVLIRPSAGIASGQTSVTGFASMAYVFTPNYATGDEAIVLSPAWSKAGDKLAFISRQASPCNGDAAVGDQPYDEFNIYTAEYEPAAASWTNCTRLTKNSSSDILGVLLPLPPTLRGVAAGSEITWNPAGDKIIFSAQDADITGREKLYWVDATAPSGAATGTQFNLAPEEQEILYYTLNGDHAGGSTSISILEAGPYPFSTDSYVGFDNFTDPVEFKRVSAVDVAGQTATLSAGLTYDHYDFDVISGPHSLMDIGQMISATGTQRWLDPDWSPNDALCDATYRDKLMAVRRTAAAASDNIIYLSGAKNADGVYAYGVSTINQVTNFSNCDPLPRKPKWAPDCSKIAFIAWDGGCTACPCTPDPPSQTDVYVINLTDAALGATATLPVTSLTATGVYQVTDYADTGYPAFYPNWSADGKVVTYAVDINANLDINALGVNYNTLVANIFGAADFDNYMEYILDQAAANGAVIAPQVVGRAGYNEFGMVQCPGNLAGSACPNAPNFPFTSVMQTSSNYGALRVFTLQDESYVTDNGGILFQNGIVTAIFPPGVVASDTVFYNTWPTAYCSGAGASETDGGGGAGSLGGVCAEDPTNDEFIVTGGEAREFFPDGTNFSQYARLIFHYCDNDEDGKVDAQTEGRGFTYNSLTGDCEVGGVPTSGGTVSVNSLAVFYWDTTQSKWIRLDGVVNTIDKTITVFSSHFSRYDTLGFRYGLAPGEIAGLRLDNIHTYPNPWHSTMRPTQNVRFNADLMRGIAGADLSVQIYDIRGSLVRTLTTYLNGAGNDPDTFFDAYKDRNFAGEGYTFIEWDGRNNAGRDVASGVYLYYLHAVDGNGFRVTQKGKIAVIH